MERWADFWGDVGKLWHSVFKLSFRTKKQLSSMTILWAVVSSGFSLETQRGEGSESGSLGVACELL